MATTTVAMPAMNNPLSVVCTRRSFIYLLIYLNKKGPAAYLLHTFFASVSVHLVYRHILKGI